MADEVRLYAIHPGMAADAFAHAAPFLARSYAESDQDLPADLLGEIASGAKQLWLAISDSHAIVGAIITALYALADGKVCRMHHCGGDHMESWLHLRAKIEEYAKAEGCVRVMLEGRPGWARKLDDYRVTAVIMEKRI